MSWKWKAVISFVALAATWTLIAPLLAGYLAVQKPLARADAVVMLGGAAEFIDRSKEAARIFRQGISPKIILTDDGTRGPWYEELNRNPRAVERARWQLIGLGVPEDAIEILPTIVDGTDDEARTVVRAIKERSLGSIILVTSSYHSRRALTSFERAAHMENSTIIIGVQSPADEPSRFWWLTERGWRTIGLEWAKTVYYRFRY